MKRNFVILTIAAVIIPLITVAASLVIYNTSGDKYLDRSRPGFMPEESEEEEDDPPHVFSDTGPIDAEILDEYLSELDHLTRNLGADAVFFSPQSLSNEALGL